MTEYQDYIEPMTGHRVGVRKNIHARPERNSGERLIYEIFFLNQDGTKRRHALHVRAFKRCRSHLYREVQEVLDDYAKEHGWEAAVEVIRE